MILIIIFTLVFIILLIYRYFLVGSKNSISNYVYDKNINYIDYPILYINLERSKDRNNYILEQFNKYNIKNYHRIVAIDGQKLSNIKEGKIDNLKYKNNYEEKELNVLACTLSHLKAIKYAYDNNFNEAIIVEDDISFELLEHWNKPLKNIIDKAPKDWVILRLHVNVNCFKNKKEFLKNNRGCYYAVAYMVNRKGMEIIINNTYKNNKEKNEEKNNEDKNNKDIEIELGKIIDGKIFPKSIAADFFIFDLPKEGVYYYDSPLFVTNNNNLKSTIHEGHNYIHINDRNGTLNLINKN